MQRIGEAIDTLKARRLLFACEWGGPFLAATVAPVEEDAGAAGCSDVQPAIPVYVNKREPTQAAVEEELRAELPIAFVPEDLVGAEQVGEDEVFVAVVVEVADGEASAVAGEVGDAFEGGAGYMGEFMFSEAAGARARLRAGLRRRYGDSMGLL